MDNEIVKMRFQIAQLEVEYEGPPSFLEDGLISFLEKVTGFYSEHKATIPTEPPQVKVGGTAPGGLVHDFDHSTNTIAAHLDVSSGPELIIAAAAHLSMVKKKSTFTRKEINEEMKSASTFYKTSMTKNLTPALNGLVKTKRLNQSGKDRFALSAQETKALEVKLAELI